jgi:hypothetical protein
MSGASRKKIGRNEPCPCGSGSKYKFCCLKRKPALPLSQRLLIAVIAVVVGGGLVLGLTALLNDEHLGVPAEQGKVWSEEHQHWH